MQWVLGEKAFYPWFYIQLKVTGILADTVSTALCCTLPALPLPRFQQPWMLQWARKMKHLSGLMVYRPALTWCLWWGHHETDINPFVLALPEWVFIWIKTFSWPWGFYIYIIPWSLNRYKKCFLSLILLIFFLFSFLKQFWLATCWVSHSLQNLVCLADRLGLWIHFHNVPTSTSWLFPWQVGDLKK